MWFNWWSKQLCMALVVTINDRKFFFSSNHCVVSCTALMYWIGFLENIWMRLVVHKWQMTTNILGDEIFIQLVGIVCVNKWSTVTFVFDASFMYISYKCGSCMLDIITCVWFVEFIITFTYWLQMLGIHSTFVTFVTLYTLWLRKNSQKVFFLLQLFDFSH